MVTLKVRSHQTRMTRIARLIYMLSQCKDAKDNPAALFARMRRHEWRELKNLNFGGYSHRVNQSGACSNSDVITSGGRKSKTKMENKVIVVVRGTRSCLYIFVLLQKQEYILQPDWNCLAEAPPMTQIRVCCVVNFMREWRE